MSGSYVNNKNKKRIAVAMSGGVDSSVAAALLNEQGHEVIGVTLRLHENALDSSLPVICGGGSYVEDARRVAEALGIQHHVLDFRQAFLDEVVKPFAESYAHGETPNPCVLCNRRIKFGALIDAARELGADVLATGHYAQITQGAQGPELHCGDDASRDQGYFLFAVPRERFGYLRFPLGGMSKTETRTLAEKYKLPVASKPDSQDICFVPEGDYASVVRRFSDEAFKPGDIVDEKGFVLGRHEGILNFTVGQRRGLNLHDRVGDNNEPLFVLRLDPEMRRIVVGPRKALEAREVTLRDVNWLGEDVPKSGIDVMARLRSAMTPAPARFSLLDDGTGKIVFKEPVSGVAPGQAGVVYDGSRVLGGGWIVGGH